jgi:hypothetical protein
LIRKIYLYLFTIVGLSLIVIGGVRLIDLGLKMTIFKQADQQRYSYEKMPPYAPVSETKLNDIAAGQTTVQVTEEEKAQIQRWLADYKSWREREEKIDPMTSERQREASNSIAMIIVGLPLYLYHWRIIKKETKKA